MNLSVSTDSGSPAFKNGEFLMLDFLAYFESTMFSANIDGAK